MLTNRSFMLMEQEELMKQQYKEKKKGRAEAAQKKWNWKLLPLQLI